MDRDDAARDGAGVAQFGVGDSLTPTKATLIREATLRLSVWGWFWIVDDPTTITWVGFVGIMFDVTIMPVIFWISGYLAPLSLAREGAGAYLASKAKRLLLPWALAVLTLFPP